MGKNARTYTFTDDNGNQYVADNGIGYSVASRIYLNEVIDNAVADQIIGSLNGTSIADGAKPDKCDNYAKDSFFDPRFLEFSYNVGTGLDKKNYKLKVVAYHRDEIVTMADGVADALEAAGADVDCIKLIGEEFQNIFYEVQPPGTVPSTTVTTRFAPYYWTGYFEYPSDVGYGETAHLKYKMATDIENSPPSGLPADTGFVPLGAMTCARKGSRRVPRRLTVVSQHDGGKQKTIIPIASLDFAQIRATQEVISAAPAAICTKYNGESFTGVGRYI